MGIKPPRPRKAHPSAFSRNDCHTCASRGRKCDRQIPRCGNCEHSGNVCGGFAMQLSWQPGFSTYRKPSKRSVVRWTDRRTSNSSGRPPRFEFITERPGIGEGTGALVETRRSDRRDPIAFVSSDTCSCSERVNETDEFQTSQSNSENRSPSPTSSENMMNEQLQATEALIEPEASDEGPGSPSAGEITNLAFSDLCRLSSYPATTIPPKIMYDSLFERLEPAFDRCMPILRCCSIVAAS